MASFLLITPFSSRGISQEKIESEINKNSRHLILKTICIVSLDKCRLFLDRKYPKNSIINFPFLLYVEVEFDLEGNFSAFSNLIPRFDIFYNEIGSTACLKI
ncbi:hypothetical protein BpHYR1_017189 [Brachionus plicatilis]|uniref:Uncharacterized protein n=1 Tax=Brachionus plicatilis TaxID=10195 RepID=A0A3M7QIX2_BRAPC|nr:hypothetical protein BpHYR1_017189 [Brachionus plicatilis]